MEFIYLGSVESETISSILDINPRISNAAYKFNKLEKLWKQSGISLMTKALVYRTTVMAKHLY